MNLITYQYSCQAPPESKWQSCAASKMCAAIMPVVLLLLNQLGISVIAHLTASSVFAGILQCSMALMPYMPKASCLVFGQMVSLKPMDL